MPEVVRSDFAETLRRRESIVCADNPAPDRDYVVSLLFDVKASPPNAWRGRLIMVPDRLILAADGLATYLTVAAPDVRLGLEALTVQMFDDLNNQIIPRWLSMCLSDGSRTAILQDGQPNWHNDTLLAAIHAGGSGLPSG